MAANKALLHQAQASFFTPNATAPRSYRNKCNSRGLAVTRAQSMPVSQNEDGDTSRRALLAAALLAGPLLSTSPAIAEDASSAPKVFFDVLVDRQPLGRIVIAVDGAKTGAKIGAQRFIDLAEGKEGTSLRRTKIELIQDNYWQDSGLKSLSYKASGRTAITGGPDAELLEQEMAKSTAKHDGPGVVSFTVLNAKERESTEKLVAIKGQLVTVTEVRGDVPNGSAFAITSRAEPSLDATNLVVGHVVEGQDVVDAINALPRVKDNSGSPFFQAGKVAKDKRALVAERAFGKPFAKITIEQCGLLA